MPQIGQINTLTIKDSSPHGFYLDGGTLGNILLPARYTPESKKTGDQIKVFIYLDSEDRLVATTETPFAKVGEFALLRASAITQIGAFLDWGLSKDLFVPFREQKQKMKEGQRYLVYVYLDDATKRIAASAKIEKFLDNVSPHFKPGEKVDLTFIEATDIGYKAIINNTHTGLIYKNQASRIYEPGEHASGYIIRIRDDEKIDLSPEPVGYQAIDGISAQLLEKLNTNRGFLPLTDQSSPEEIQLMLGISKKAFKKAIGALYKQGKIRLENDGIQLLEQ
ncbi:MAG: S1 RNA-binding domain-containing protein [Marinilabiliaceae bacterium]